MVINILLLDRTVESFIMGIHLRRLRIGVPVGLVKSPDFSVKVLHKLAAVVGENVLEPVWKHLLDSSEKLLFCALFQRKRVRLLT